MTQCQVPKHRENNLSVAGLNCGRRGGAPGVCVYLRLGLAREGKARRIVGVPVLVREHEPKVYRHWYKRETGQIVLKPKLEPRNPRS